MSDISSAIAKYNRLINVQSIGIDAAQAALNASFPYDFEYYMMAFELVSWDDKTIDYFVFPINPSTYSDSIVSPTTVQNTMGGVSITGNSSFSPHDIMIKGNFGRKFKVLSGNDVDPAVAHLSTASGVFDSFGFNANSRGKSTKQISSIRVKTGFGATKVLEGICNKSKADIDGKPNRLYMYNPAFSSNYMVKVMNFKISQNVESDNLVWGYEMSLKAVAPLDVVVSLDNKKHSLSGALTKSVVQNTANRVANATIKLLQ